MEVSDHQHYAPVEADAPLEYTLQYKPIVSCEQRSRYKEDFNSQYNEYRDLHKAIDKVSKRFAQLEEKLRQQHEGTSAWQVGQFSMIFAFSFAMKINPVIMVVINVMFLFVVCY